MAITTWSGFLDQLTRLLDGDETSGTSITLATLQQVISMGERRVYREVRCRWNEKAFASVVVTNNRGPLPDDFESPSILHFGGAPLVPVTEEFILTQPPMSVTQYFAIAGAAFTFAGEVIDNALVEGRYFYRHPDLNETTLPLNDMFLNEPNLFVFACLSAAAPFYGQNAQMPIWEAQYTSLRDSVNTAHKRAAYSVGRLQMRPSAGIQALPIYVTATASASDSTYVDTGYVVTDYAA